MQAALEGSRPCPQGWSTDCWSQGLARSRADRLSAVQQGPEKKRWPAFLLHSEGWVQGQQRDQDTNTYTLALSPVVRLGSLGIYSKTKAQSPNLEILISLDLIWARAWIFLKLPHIIVNVHPRLEKHLKESERKGAPFHTTQQIRWGVWLLSSRCSHSPGTEWMRPPCCLLCAVGPHTVERPEPWGSKTPGPRGAQLLKITMANCGRRK